MEIIWQEIHIMLIDINSVKTYFSILFDFSLSYFVFP